MADSAVPPAPDFQLSIGSLGTFTAFVQLIRALGTEQETAKLEKVVSDLRGARVPLQEAINKAPKFISSVG